MQHADQLHGYSTILLAAAPLASQLAIAPIRWILFFPIFAVPALALMMTVGHLSKAAAVQTFRKMAPIAAGIGWALTWHIAEKLYVESLRAAQLFMYILFSIRPTLTWAISCDHNYNSEYCNDFADTNTTVTKEEHHYPDNFWPAQEFNRYVIRDNPTITEMPKTWEPNMWYLGPSNEAFSFAIPSIHLTILHIITWSIIYTVIVKYYDRLGDILTRVFVLIPLMLYVTVAMGLTVFGFHFTDASVQLELDDKKINEDPFDFWADLRGGFRTSLLIVDYSCVFTGVILLATSRLRSGVGGLNALLLVPIMTIVPAMQTIIRAGCEGHVADIQPHYKIYASTDETISFDLLPVCFATSSLGPIWSGLYFTAQYLYTSLGPMVVYTAFIYQSFIDDFPTVQNVPRKCIGIISLAFFMLSLFLYMPLGTKIVAFFRYTSQSAFVQLATFLVIFFLYGWQRIEQDVLMTMSAPSSPSILSYLVRPTSPVYITLLFTVVPMLICSKLVAVFDFLATGNDVLTHIKAGVQFLPFPSVISRLVGYLVMFAPVIIMLLGALLTIYNLAIKHQLPLSDTVRPTAEWMAHASANTNKPRTHSLAYVLFTRVIKVADFRTAVFCLLIFETFVCICLIALFGLNTFAVLGLTSSRIANYYRSCMILFFLLIHLYSLREMRRSHDKRIIGTGLDPYIAMATLETAMLNAYMWMFASDHKWGLDMPPVLIIACNTWVRGFCILLAIAAKAYSEKHNRPTTIRDASDVDDGDLPRMEDPEDDSPVVFGLGNP